MDKAGLHDDDERGQYREVRGGERRERRRYLESKRAAGGAGGRGGDEYKIRRR
jgi:hypothetical protein